MARNKRRAFSLMEVIIVMALLVVVAAVAIPVTWGMMTRSRLRAAGEEVRTLLTQTRNRAVSERRPYRFAVKDGSNEYRIAPDTINYWDDGEAGLDLEVLENEQPPMVKEAAVKVEQVKFDSANGPSRTGSGDWRTIAIFLSDGTAEGDVEVSLTMDGHQPVVVRVEASTGAITTAAVPANNPARVE